VTKSTVWRCVQIVHPAEMAVSAWRNCGADPSALRQLDLPSEHRDPLDRTNAVDRNFCSERGSDPVL
jgi:hypothetical protein